MKNESQPGSQQLQVKVPDEMLAGAYTNMLQVAHTKEEFVLDFMNVFPPQGIVTARVIVNPGHMKRILKALEENLKQYEQQHGTIAESSNPQQQFGFRTE